MKEVPTDQLQAEFALQIKLIGETVTREESKQQMLELDSRARVSLINSIVSGPRDFDASLALFNQPDTQAIAHEQIHLLMKQARESKEIIAILSQSTVEDFFDRLQVMFKWSCAAQIPTNIPKFSIDRTSMAHITLDKFLEFAAAHSTDRQAQFIDQFAQTLTQHQQKATDIEKSSYYRVISDVLKLLSSKTIDYAEATHFQAVTAFPIRALSAPQRQIALALTESCVEQGMLNSSFWFDLVINHNPFNIHPAYLITAEEKLLGNSDQVSERYWSKNTNPERYFNSAISLITAIIERLATQNNQNANRIKIALDNMRLGNGIPYQNFIQFGNQLVQLINNSGGIHTYDDQGNHVGTQQLQSLDVTNFANIGKVGLLILQVVYAGVNLDQAPYYEEDRMLVGIADELALRGSDKKSSVKVLTVGDLALKYPDANIYTLERIIREIKKGDIDNLAKANAEIQKIKNGRQNTSSWKRYVRGFGILT